eukprot:gene26504-33092_t
MQSKSQKTTPVKAVQGDAGGLVVQQASLCASCAPCSILPTGLENLCNSSRKEQYVARVKELRKLSKDRLKADDKAQSENKSQPVNEEGEENPLELSVEMKSAEDDEVDEEEELDFALSDDVVGDSAIIDLKAKSLHCASVVRFISLIERAVPLVTELLHSKTSGDVTESLRFFTRAVNFNVKGALSNFKSSFSLIWHTDLAIRSDLLATFKSVYLCDGAAEKDAKRLRPEEVALNLIRMSISLEKIVTELLGEHDVGVSVIEAVWSRVQVVHAAQLASPVAVSFTSTSELGAALQIVAMIARCSHGAWSVDKIRLVIEASGLSESTPITADALDPSALRAGLVCLQAMPQRLHMHKDKKPVKNVEALHAAMLGAVPTLVRVIAGDFCRESERDVRAYFPVCEEAVHALFHVHPSPDRVLASAVQTMYARMTQSGNSKGSFVLSRLLFVLGQTALNVLVFTERIAAYSKKYAISQAGGDSAAAKKDHKTSSTDKSSHLADAMEEEMGQSAELDAQAEQLLAFVCEQELVLRNLLGKFLPLVRYVAANDSQQFNHVLVRETATLALCRYMSISSVTCESCLPLLFTTLEREGGAETGSSSSGSVIVRNTIMIALGDLAFRFPNSIEPWTDRMYSKLRDPVVEVRYNTLMVITHLVLNDMIKVKGQVAHVALSLNDESTLVADLARLFFVKLSERSNNPVYNLLGDIISTFSKDSSDGKEVVKAENEVSVSGEESASVAMDVTSLSTSTSAEVVPSVAAFAPLTGEQFKTTMHFLLSFVQKDKQADTLCERLLIRLGLTPSLVQRRNLAFCVSELSITEKGVKKMIEQIKNIKDALYDSEVHACFALTLKNCKKVRTGGVGVAAMSAENKLDNKTALEEFEALLETIRAAANGEETDEVDGVATTEGEQGCDEEEGDGVNLTQKSVKREVKPPAPKSKASSKPAKKAPAKSTKPAATKKKASNKVKKYEESDEEDSANEPEDYESDEE